MKRVALACAALAGSMLLAGCGPYYWDKENPILDGPLRKNIVRVQGPTSFAPPQPNQVVNMPLQVQQQPLQVQTVAAQPIQQPIQLQTQPVWARTAVQQPVLTQPTVVSQPAILAQPSVQASMPTITLPTATINAPTATFNTPTVTTAPAVTTVPRPGVGTILGALNPFRVRAPSVTVGIN